MPRNIPQHLKLYTNPETVIPAKAGIQGQDGLTAIIAPTATHSLHHTTRLPGGFHEMSITLATTESEFHDWRQDRLLGRLLLEEPSGRTIWEGRVEAVALVDRACSGLDPGWQASITARGYWSNLTDSVRNRSYVSPPRRGGSIVSELLADMHPQTRQISTSTEHIADGPTIAHEYNDDWTIWRILTDPRRGIASFGSGTGARPATVMDIAVWEDRKLHYQPRSASGVTPFRARGRLWHSYMRPAAAGGGVVNLPTRVDWHDLANAVSVTYERDGGIARTPQAIDSRSISRYIRRERHVPNIGESTSATAIQRRDTELNLRSHLRPTAEGLAVNRVWDADGIEWPLCRVRAGDVVRIPDFTPSTDDLDRVTFDAYRTFFIEETLCNHTTGVLTIRPESGHETST